MLNRYKSPSQELVRVTSHAIMIAFATDNRYKSKVGQYYNSLPQETKELLSTLKSDDIKNIKLIEL